MHVIKTRATRKPTNDLPHCNPLQWTPGVRKQQAIIRSLIWKASQVTAKVTAIPIQCVDGGLSNRDQSLLVSLSSHEHDFKLALPVACSKRAHLTGTQTRPIHHFDQRTISFPQPTGSRPSSLDQGSHLFGRKYTREPLPSGWWYQWPRWTPFNSPLGFQPAKKHSNG